LGGGRPGTQSQRPTSIASYPHGAREDRDFVGGNAFERLVIRADRRRTRSGQLPVEPVQVGGRRRRQRAALQGVEKGGEGGFQLLFLLDLQGAARRPAAVDLIGGPSLEMVGGGGS
jgi:hypothetical protein